MSFYAYLEVDSGDLLRLVRADGFWAGKALENFGTMLSAYRAGHVDDPEALRWFQKLDQMNTADLARVAEIMYSGNWNYDETEYDRFVRCESSNPYGSEDEFKRAIKAVEGLWTPIESLLKTIRHALKVLPQMQGETYWFSPTETILDFRALEDTLLLAARRGGERVRIKIE